MATSGGMNPPAVAQATTEAALLEWASGADARLKNLTNQLTYVQHAVFALCIVFFFHCANLVLCPAPRRRIKHYKH